MTTAAMATMATVDAAMIMAGIIRACARRPSLAPHRKAGEESHIGHAIDTTPRWISSP
jgi:hypothetical protein